MKNINEVLGMEIPEEKNKDIDADVLDFYQDKRERDKYFEVNSYSATMLKLYEENPSFVTAKGGSYFVNKEELKVSKAFKMGSIIHKCILEKHNPHSYSNVLTDKEHISLTNILERLSPLVVSMIADTKICEESIYWKEPLDDDVRVNCKAKPDLYTKSGDLIELKTCSKIEDLPFQIMKYRYDLQLAFYKRALEFNKMPVSKCCIISVETNYPYQSHVYELSEHYLEVGKFGGEIYNKTYRGWEEILNELHFRPRKRFPKPVTVL